MKPHSVLYFVKIILLGACCWCGVATAKLDPSDPGVEREIIERFGPGASGAFMAENGMVTSASFEATMAGLNVLRHGGNAYDAAAVVQFVLTVTEPYASGIGGGLFAVCYDTQAEEVFTVDGRETAPASVGPDVFVGDDGKVESFSSRINGGRAAGVPGTLAAIAYLLEKHGTLTLSEVVEPAAEIAEEGFYITEPFARNLAAHWARLEQFPETRRHFSRPGGGPLQAGDLYRNPDLARTLRLIGREGIKVFYEGEVAGDIVATINGSPVHPGLITLGDLAAYRPKLRAPIVSTYRGYTVYGMGMPSSGGATLALMLNMLEPGPPFEGDWSAKGLQRLIDVQNLAFADRNAYMGDGDFVAVPVAALTSKAYARERVQQIKAGTALCPPLKPGHPADVVANDQPLAQESPSTTHFSVVDKERNVLSVTTTLEQHFGCGLMVPGRGFLLNNEMTDFNAKSYGPDGERVPNAPEAGKRPRSSMTPTIVMRDGKPCLTVGSPGGSRIIGITLNVLLNVLDRHMGLQRAIDEPRAIARNRRPELESPLYRDKSLLQELRVMGYRPVDAHAIGSVQAIMIDDSGWLEGAADPRRAGLALGY